MFKYEYEKINVDFDGWGFGSGKVYSIEEYHSIIDRRAEAGWRLVTSVPTIQRGTGHIQELELIFEKEI